MHLYRSIVLAIVVLWSSIAFAGVTEAEFRSQLPGRWHFSHSNDGVTISGTSTYSEDGHVTYEGTISVGEEVLPLFMEGDWNIKGDKFSVKITRSSLPEVFPVDSVQVDTVITIDETSYMYVGSSGTQYTEKRLATP